MTEFQDASQVVGNLSDAWEKMLHNEEKGEPRKHEHTYASGYHRCARNLFYQMTEGDQLPSFDADTKARFRRGKSRERQLKIDLALAGELARPSFEVQGQEKYITLRDKK